MSSDVSLYLKSSTGFLLCCFCSLQWASHYNVHTGFNPMTPGSWIIVKTITVRLTHLCASLYLPPCSTFKSSMLSLRFPPALQISSYLFQLEPPTLTPSRFPLANSHYSSLWVQQTLSWEFPPWLWSSPHFPAMQSQSILEDLKNIKPETVILTR